jgi:hypothetical protein
VDESTIGYNQNDELHPGVLIENLIFDTAQAITGFDTKIRGGRRQALRSMTLSRSCPLTRP